MARLFTYIRCNYDYAIIMRDAKISGKTACTKTLRNSRRTDR